MRIEKLTGCGTRPVFDEVREAILVNDPRLVRAALGGREQLVDQSRHGPNPSRVVQNFDTTNLAA